MTKLPKTDTPLHIMAGGKDRTDEMLEHMTRVQLHQAVLASVTLSTTEDFTARVVQHMNARDAGCLSLPTLALLNATCHEAVAVAMPRVRLIHPAHPTLQ